MMNFSTPIRFASLAILALLLGCRGQVSHESPIMIEHGMEFQPRYNSYEGNTFFADGRNMRTPPEGTVARGMLKDDDIFWRGGDSAHPVEHSPVPMTMGLLERGQERFDIYCSPCHGKGAEGRGMVALHGFMPPPPNLLDDRISKMPDGQLYRAISFGARSMPSYGKQIPESDRWAIVAYLRALQLGAHMTPADVPDSVKSKLR